MENYLWLLLYTALAEVARRVVLSLITAYTGPLSKIPGPALSKLTPLFWRLKISSGDFYYLLPELFKKYGNTVRVGKFNHFKQLADYSTNIIEFKGQRLYS